MTSSEIKHPPVICILNSPSDAALKQFMTSMKNVFPPNHLVCSMKAAIDLAARGKPPVIKMPTPDMMNLPGNLVSLVVSNWIVTQLRKPPPKAAAKKPPPKRGGKAGNQPMDHTPRQPDPESLGPYFIYITDYPKNIEQMKVMVSSASPPIVSITLEGQLVETSRKGNQQANSVPPIDWKAFFEQDMPFVNVNINVPQPDDVCKLLFTKITNIFNGFHKYREQFLDYRFISIPKFPPMPLPIPQVAPEKTTKMSQASIAKIGNNTAQSTEQLPPPPTVDIHRCLKSAYRKTLTTQLASYLERTESPTFSPNFQHAAELLPSFPLPASLSLVLSRAANQRAPELFTIRSMAHRTKTPLNTIIDTLVLQEFEKMIGYSVGERRHIEQIPLDFVPNVLAPLLSFYSSFKTAEFAGKILLAFYHEIPVDRPIINIEESLKLPLALGFGKWAEANDLENTPIDTNKDDINVNANNDNDNNKSNENQKDNEKNINKSEGGNEQLTSQVPTENSTVENTSREEPTHNSIGINVGNNDMFQGFVDNVTTLTRSTYFCESGLRVETVPAEIKNSLVSSLNFNCQYFQGPRFSFNISQMESTAAKTGDEEEDDDNIYTSVAIRGVLAGESQCYIDYSQDNASLTMFTKKATIEFDISNGRTVVTGVKNEEKRIFLPNGEIIRYAPHPIIYKPDGSIQQYVRGEWHLVDSNGKSYVKRNGQWFKDPKNEATSELASTYFTSRKVTNYSNGVSFIEDEGGLTVSFPDGTKYIQKDGLFEHPDLPSIRVQNGITTVTTRDSVSTFDSHRKECSVDARAKEYGIGVSINFKCGDEDDETPENNAPTSSNNNSNSITSNNSNNNNNNNAPHVVIQYGQFKNAMTMVDLLTGVVAHAGSRRVFYLNEEWKWSVGEQNCSKKDILQHFLNNDFIDKLTPVDAMNRDEKLAPIIANGHKPRLFVVEKEQSSIAVKELLAAADFQAAMEQSAARISKKEDANVTLWFDTVPKSYREIVITPKISEEQKESILAGIKQQRSIEEKRNEILNSVGDPKWRKLEEKQKNEEEQIQQLLLKYKVTSQNQ